MLKPHHVTVEAGGEHELVLTVSGDFDIRSADDIAAVVAEAEAARPRRLVLDLSDVTFMDSVALAVLIGARERALQRGAAVVVRAGRGPVRDLLRIVGLTELLEDRDAADG